MTNNQFPLQSFLPWHLSWLTVILALLTVGTFIAVSGPGGPYPVTMMGRSVGVGYSESSGAVPPMAAGVPSRNGSVSSMPVYYPYPSPDVPVTDTREFLKIYYNASLRTRDVPGTTRRVETTVRGYDGRIDQQSSSEKYGYVSFALPQSKYDAFRTELESLVGSRFLTVNISSQNLLSQKVSIEEQQKQADATLAEYKAARQRLVNTHTSTVRSLQAQIDADVQELASLRAQTQTYDIQIRIQSLSNELSTLRAQLANENTSYSVQLKNADANIKYAEDWRTAVQKQDTALMDNVATVSGSVSIRWISLWEMAQLYLPRYCIPGIFAVLAFCSYLWDRRRFGTA